MANSFLCIGLRNRSLASRHLARPLPQGLSPGIRNAHGFLPPFVLVPVMMAAQKRRHLANGPMNGICRIEEYDAARVIPPRAKAALDA